MQIFFLTTIFVFGLLFWSFSSVLLTRLKTWEKGIMNWRSHCPKCWHNLWFFDLFPVLSYIFRWWKCAYCKTKISLLYPILELSLWILFVLTSYFLIDINLIFLWNSLEIIKLFFYLILTFLAFLIAVYDILYLEIHETMMIFSVIFSFIFVAIQTLFPEIRILNTFDFIENTKNLNIYRILIAAFTISSLYFISVAWLREIYDFLILAILISILSWFIMFFKINLSDFPILSWTLWALWLFIFFFLQIVLSAWRRMWAWDLRIAIFMWIILWWFYSLIWWFICYLVWSIIWIIIIIINKLKWKNALWIQVPFWPFLVIWMMSTLYFQNFLLNLFEKFFFNN